MPHDKRPRFKDLPERLVTRCLEHRHLCPQVVKLLESLDNSVFGERFSSEALSKVPRDGVQALRANPRFGICTRLHTPSRQDVPFGIREAQLARLQITGRRVLYGSSEEPSEPSTEGFI